MRHDIAEITIKLRNGTIYTIPRAMIVEARFQAQVTRIHEISSPMAYQSDEVFLHLTLIALPGMGAQSIEAPSPELPAGTR